MIADLRRAGFAFDTAWFAPHLEFRYPIVFACQLSGREYRNSFYATEPWYVLGEEPAGVEWRAMLILLWSDYR